MSDIKGRVHSFQSLGAVDGPGIRYVIFMQGCPYKCPYCHNPDTKPFDGGTEYTAKELVDKVKRYKSYFGSEGGVTVSGGEPLMQAEFVAQFFELCHQAGINTALDTAGVYPTEKIQKVLCHTDTVLCDIKFSSDEQYTQMVGQPLENVKSFLALCEECGCRVIVRHVVVPGITDTPESVEGILQLTRNYKNVEKTELLPFKKLCLEKYDRLGIPFPLRDTPECDPETINTLKKLL